MNKLIIIILLGISFRAHSEFNAYSCLQIKMIYQKEVSINVYRGKEVLERLYHEGNQELYEKLWHNLNEYVAKSTLKMQDFSSTIEACRLPVPKEQQKIDIESTKQYELKGPEEYTKLHRTNTEVNTESTKYDELKDPEEYAKLHKTNTEVTTEVTTEVFNADSDPMHILINTLSGE